MRGMHVLIEDRSARASSSRRYRKYIHGERRRVLRRPPFNPAFMLKQSAAQPVASSRLARTSVAPVRYIGGSTTLIPIPLMTWSVTSRRHSDYPVLLLTTHARRETGTLTWNWVGRRMTPRDPSRRPHFPFPLHGPPSPIRRMGYIKLSSCAFLSHWECGQVERRFLSRVCLFPGVSVNDCRVFTQINFFFIQNCVFYSFPTKILFFFYLKSSWRWDRKWINDQKVLQFWKFFFHEHRTSLLQLFTYWISF